MVVKTKVPPKHQRHPFTPTNKGPLLPGQPNPLSVHPSSDHLLFSPSPTPLLRLGTRLTGHRPGTSASSHIPTLGSRWDYQSSCCHRRDTTTPGAGVATGVVRGARGQDQGLYHAVVGGMVREKGIGTEYVGSWRRDDAETRGQRERGTDCEQGPGARDPGIRRLRWQWGRMRTGD